MSVELSGGREWENDVKCWEKKKCVLNVETIVNGLKSLWNIVPKSWCWKRQCIEILDIMSLSIELW